MVFFDKIFNNSKVIKWIFHIGLLAFLALYISGCTPPDTTAPTISLTGANPQFIENGATYIELGANAQDNVDGDISSNIVVDSSSVNSSIPGHYTVKYTISDAAGNVAVTQSRLIAVALPVASINFPTKIGGTDIDILSVRGTAHALSGIASVEVNGIPAISNNNYENWWVEVPLSIGDNELSLKVVDNTNNEWLDASALNIHRKYSIQQTAIAFDSRNNRALLLSGRAATGNDAPSLFSIDLSNGKRTLISNSTSGTGKNFIRPSDLTYDSANNRVLVVESADYAEAIFAVDLSNGNRTIISDSSIGTGKNFMRPESIILDSANNRALVTDLVIGAVIAVDLNNGNRTIISDDHTGTGVNNTNPVGIVLDGANNRALTIGWDGDALVAVDLVNGNRSVISSRTKRGRLNSSVGMVLDSANNQVLIIYKDLKNIISIDLSNGNRTPLSNNTTNTGADFKRPTSMAFDKNNSRILLLDQHRDDVISVNINKGNRTIIANNPTGTGESFKRISHLTLDTANNRVLVTDRDLKSVIAVDLNNGNRSIISNTFIGTGYLFEEPKHIVLDSSHNRAILIDAGDIFSVDLSTGNRSIISNRRDYDLQFNYITGIALDHENNRILMTDSRTATLFSIKLNNGHRSVLSGTHSVTTRKNGFKSTIGNGINFQYPMDVILDSANNRALIIDVGLRAVIAVNLSDGSRRIISDQHIGTGVNFDTPQDMIFDHTNNRLLVVDTGNNYIIAVDLTNGNRTIISKKMRNLANIVIDYNNDHLLGIDWELDAVVAIDIKTNFDNTGSAAANGDLIILSK